jgi:hypothetical protein
LRKPNLKASSIIKAATDESDGYYRAYEEYSKVLRTWLVAYGIGAPVLLFTNDHLSDAVRKSSLAAYIAWFFLIGVGLQVLLAAVNKNVMWMLYWGEKWPELDAQPLYRAAAWLSFQYWIDVLTDVGTIVLFGAATLISFRIVLG